MRNNTVPAVAGFKETFRMELFSDGVFAIAITLQVLELIQVLHPQTEESLQNLLLKHIDSFLAFGIGFFTILVCWVNHHLVFSHVKKTDEGLMWVNGFVLMIVSFTPFPTSILAKYFETEPKLALAIFEFNYIMMSIAAYSITAYVYKNVLIERSSRELFFRLKRLYKYSIIYTTLNFFICFVSVPLAIGFYCILFFVFTFPRKSSKMLVYRKPKNNRIIASPLMEL